MLSVEKPISSREDDFLKRGYFADNLANAILEYNESNHESLTIGLYGKWGSGKTSIINLMLEKLENDANIIIFKFEPWLFSDTQQLISNFFKDFAKIVKHKDYAEEAKKIGEELETYATFFEPMSLIPEPTVSVLSAISSKVFSSVGKASKKWGQLKTKSLTDTKKSIETHLKKLNKKILIIIDDIDRLNNTEIRQIFQMIKALGNFPNTIYLTSMDKEVIVDALSEVQKGDGSEYLEKIINVPFEVPSISQNEVETFLFKKLNEIIANIDEKDFDSRYWGNVYHSGYKHFFINIRDVVRYVNILRFNYMALENKVNVIDLIVITAFQIFEPKIYELIRHNKEYFTGNLPNNHYSDDSHKKNLQLIIEESCLNLQKLSKDSYTKLLQEVFVKVKEVYTNTYYVDAMKNCRSNSQICTPEFFDTYFTFTLNDNEISSYDMKKYINKASNENEFREAIDTLISNHKITRFLERLQDFTSTNIQEDKFPIVIKVLLDLGDGFPKEKEGMFSQDNNMQIMRIIHQLPMRIEDEAERFNLLENAVKYCNNSINTICQMIRIFMQENGEYEKEAKSDDRLTISNEHLQELKQLLSNKIDIWCRNNLVLVHNDALSILYVWLKIEPKATKEHITKLLYFDGYIVEFLKIFVSYSFSQSSSDYVTRKNEKFNYNNIKDFVDVSELSKKVFELRNIETLPIDDKYLLEKYTSEYLKSNSQTEIR